jgi:hypothetical protein
LGTENLLFHPHLHRVVPGGGISPDGTRWISCRPNFFLPLTVLSRLFRRLFLQYLQEAFDAGKLRFFSLLQALQDPEAFTRYLDPVQNVEWVVYAKRRFAGPQQVADYVGRYTHRVPVFNHRLVDIEDGHVKFNLRETTATTISRKPCPSRRTSLSGDSCFMFYQVGSIAFATTGSSAIDIARRSWSVAGNFSAWLLQRNFLCLRLLSSRRRAKNTLHNGYALQQIP